MLSEAEQIAFQIAVTPFIAGLINELAISVQLEVDYLIALVPYLKNEKQPPIEIRAKAKWNAFTSQIFITEPKSILINKQCLENISDLVIMGFNKQQLTLLEHNVLSTVYLERIYEKCKTQRPVLLEVLERILETKFEFEEIRQYAGLANLFSRLPQREAFILSDTCGNVDGSTGNPLSNVMFGKDESIIEYHPIPVAFLNGTSKLLLVQYDPTKIRSIGKIPERLESSLAFIKTGIIPMHPYAHRIINEGQLSPTTDNCLETFTLLSKRSLVPILSDYQIKTSFPAQITSEIRTIDWILARDIMHSSNIVSQLAQKQLLPEKLWVLLTQYMSQANNDDRTTFLIRDGLQDAISNSAQKGIPSEFTPITACSLTTRNILTPGKTLMESMIEFGFNGMDLFKEISRAMIHTQLDLISLGWIPDSHTQNVIYLFDFKRKTFAGILQRDAESEKLHLEKLELRGIHVPLANDINPKLLRNLVDDDKKLITLYLHHTIYMKHIVPMANFLHEKYSIDATILCEYVQQCLVEWKKKNADYNIEQDIDLSDRFYDRNLACKTLNIGEPPHYRLIQNHPLLPKHFD
ncbi:unnamed protein product [Rotaria socialis]|uniref:Siderophore biosynthesis protein n=1 Tax=Rotaria socialis TaxID=392032 RepID=A0A821NVK7_9BILA|nr:unnamed protein product [Rotaria socialis]CAF4791751.1 unnamed protein product [Rotaria socialis]